MTAKVTCLGCAYLDLIFGIDELPNQDGKSIARSFAESGGGMAANSAVTVSRLGGQALWCGRLGDDDRGRRILEGLRQEEVNVQTAKLIPGTHSPQSVVLKDRTGNRAIIVHRAEFDDTDLSWLPMEQLLDADAVLADSSWIEGAVALLSAARAKGMPAVLDADTVSGQTPSRSAAMLRAVAAASHVVFSAPGLASLFAAPTPEEGLRQARNYAPFVAVTLGGDGVLWLDATGTVRHIPSFPVDAVETVGAGDIFHGAFAFALGRGQSEEDGLRLAAAVAAIKCAGEGGRVSFPRMPDVEKLLASERPAPLNLAT